MLPSFSPIPNSTIKRKDRKTSVTDRQKDRVETYSSLRFCRCGNNKIFRQTPFLFNFVEISSNTWLVRLFYYPLSVSEDLFEIFCVLFEVEVWVFMTYRPFTAGWEFGPGVWGFVTPEREVGSVPCILWFCTPKTRQICTNYSIECFYNWIDIESRSIKPVL